MSIERPGSLAVALLLVLSLSACGDTEEADVAAAPAESGMAMSESTAPAVPADAPATIADLFPEGEGKDIVLSNCASCHAVACAAIGRRSAGRWQGLKEAHEEHVPSLSAERREIAFAYLAANFSESQPEPYVPPEFLERGCTPF